MIYAQRGLETLRFRGSDKSTTHKKARSVLHSAGF